MSLILKSVLMMTFLPHSNIQKIYPLITIKIAGLYRCIRITLWHLKYVGTTSKNIMLAYNNWGIRPRGLRVMASDNRYTRKKRERTYPSPQWEKWSRNKMWDARGWLCGAELNSVRKWSYIILNRSDAKLHLTTFLAWPKYLTWALHMPNCN